jgi:hypothetical protein
MAISSLLAALPDIEGGAIDVEINVEAVEDAEDGYLEPPVVSINIGHLITSAAIAQQIGEALLAAAAVARQPLPQHHWA